MKYRKHDAKEYAREHMKGIWAAALTPFTADFAIDNSSFRSNMRHWTRDLGIDGLFICGKQGEFFSMTVAERKHTFDLAVEEAASGNFQTIMSCSDQNVDTVIDLAKHAEAIGADYIVVHAPVLHFFKGHDETVYEYYRYISERVNIGIALWSHPDSGYLLSPELCARIADIKNVVAIKYSVPREMYAKLTRTAGERIIVSTASEEEWFDNIVELGWRLYLCFQSSLFVSNSRRSTHARLHRSGIQGRDRQGARYPGQPEASARCISWDTTAREAPRTCEVLAGSVGPKRRPGPAADVGAYSVRKNGDQSRI